MLRDPELRKALRYPNATVSGDHYVLPVSVNFRHKIAGVIHRTSSTGETIFVEPAEIASLSAERVLLKNEEDRETRKILRRLSGDVGRVCQPLSKAIEAMARLDFVTAKARFSRDFAMSPPDLNAEGRLWLRQARHPLLENLFRGTGGGCRVPGAGKDEEKDSGSRGTSGGSQSSQPASGEATPATRHPPPATRHVVPIDVRLGHPFNMLIITGPNTGGKTVTLKTTGLLEPDGPGGHAHSRGRRQPRARLRAHLRGHRRRAEPGAIAEHVQLAHLAHRPNLSPGQRQQPGAAR